MKRTLHNYILAAAVALLAAGGAAGAAEKEAPIDWPARAATVKVGMTRAEVEKILPMCTSTNAHKTFGTGLGTYYVGVSYPVSEEWSVDAAYYCPTNLVLDNSLGTNLSQLITSNVLKRAHSDSESSQDRLTKPISITKIVKQWPVVMVKTNVVMNEALALEIGTRYVQEYEPNLDITSFGEPTAMFDPTSWDIRRGEKGAWSVRFNIPSYLPRPSRQRFSHYITIDRLGRVWGTMTMAP